MMLTVACVTVARRVRVSRGYGQGSMIIGLRYHRTRPTARGRELGLMVLKSSVISAIPDIIAIGQEILGKLIHAAHELKRTAIWCISLRTKPRRLIFLPQIEFVKISHHVIELCRAQLAWVFLSGGACGGHIWRSMGGKVGAMWDC